MTWQLRPIGSVHSPRVEDDLGDFWGDVRGWIALDPEVVPEGAVDGLDGFSHLEVVYGLDRSDAPAALSGGRHIRGRTEWGLVGELAQRNKVRFNRLAVSRCEVVKVEPHRIEVVGLDALHGSPVFEIKPWMDEYGPRGATRQPDWTRELMADYYRPESEAR